MNIRGTSAIKLNEINSYGSHVRVSAGLPRRVPGRFAAVCGSLRKSRRKSLISLYGGSLAEVRKSLPLPLKSLDLFTAAEVPHTPYARVRARERRAHRDLPRSSA